MEFRPEYWKIERAASDRAEALELIDDRLFEIMRSKTAKRTEAIKRFRETLPLVLIDRPIPEVNWEFPEFKARIERIFERYFIEFTEKLAYGERYGELHPDVPLRANLGYQIGDTLVDIATHDAVSFLSGAYYMDYRNGGAKVHYITDEEAVKILGRVISATLASLKVLEPKEQEALDGWPQILRINPEPRTLSPMTTKAKLLELIDTQVLRGVMKWADEKQRTSFEIDQRLAELTALSL